MRDQATINDLLQQCIAQYAGQRPDYYGYAGECLSLAKRWVDIVKNGNLNGQMQAPASSDGWGSGYWSNPPVLIGELFDRQGYDPNADYPAGSLFVNVRSHHIGILVSNNPGQATATVFEANADPDGSPAHTAQRSKSRIDGILVIKVAAPPPPAPAVTHHVTDYSAPIKYLVGEGHNKWDLSGNTFADVAAHPVDTAGPNKVITVTAVLHIIGSDLEQYQYYLEDRNNLQGWNSQDCSPYVEPPKPYQAPAAPLPIPQVNYYDLQTTVAYFDTATDAQKDINAKGTVNKGKYVLLKSDGMARQITKNNADTVTYWINDLDNKVPEVAATPTLPVDPPAPKTEPVNDTSATSTIIADVTPIKQAKPVEWGWLNPDHSPTVFRYKGTTPVPIKDLEGLKPSLTMNAGLQGPISRYTMVNGTEYLIPDSEFKKGNAYGIPSMLMEPLDLPQKVEYQATQTEEKWLTYLETGFSSARRLITDITPMQLDKAAYRTKQLIDGFKAGRKK